MFTQTLAYLLSGGNQLWLCLPSVLVLLSLLFIPGAISFRTSDGILGSLQQWLIIALLWLPFLCKTIDNAAHIRAGKSAEPVPFGLSGELRLPELAQYLVGIAILTLPFIFLPAGLYTPIFYALLPAIHDSFLESRTFAAMLSPAALLAACARIGFARYCHILLSYLILFLALTGFGILLAVPVTYVLFALVAGVAQGANVMPLQALAITILTLGLYLNGLVWMFATLYPTMLCHGWRRPAIPDDDDEPLEPRSSSEEDGESAKHGDD